MQRQAHYCLLHQRLEPATHGELVRPQGLGRPAGRHSEFTLSAAGAARVNLGVYYMPGQLQYRQPPAVLAQYLRQSLLNGTFVNVNLVQQVLEVAAGPRPCVTSRCPIMSVHSRINWAAILWANINESRVQSAIAS